MFSFKALTVSWRDTAFVSLAMALKVVSRPLLRIFVTSLVRLGAKLTFENRLVPKSEPPFGSDV